MFYFELFSKLFCILLYNHNIMRLVKRFVYKVSNIQVPSVDLTNYLARTNDWQTDCRNVSSILKKYGLLYVKAPQVDLTRTEAFFDLMERYFEKRSQQYNQGLRHIDIVQDVKFAGFQHCFKEKFQSFRQEKRRLTESNKSLTPETPAADPTWRFRWIMNYHKNVKPNDFPEFEQIMQTWCSQLKDATLTVAQMTAIGLGLAPQTFTNYINGGDIYLAPTGIDMRNTKLGDVITGFHHDLDLFTTHSKSNYPGLHAWMKTGEKFPVNIPDGHLLIQAGEQLQWLTGGQIKAGFHEVIHNQKAQDRRIARMNANKSSWRIASVVFNNMESSTIMEPLPEFRNKETSKLYPSMTAQQYIKQRIYAIMQQTS